MQRVYSLNALFVVFVLSALVSARPTGRLVLAAVQR